MVRSVVFLPSLASGCLMEAILWPPDTGKSADLVELREYECVIGQCSKILAYEWAELEACYGWDPVVGWLGTPPDQVVDNCAPEEVCLLEVASDSVEAWNADECEHCVEGEKGQVVPLECCFNEEDLEANVAALWETEGTAIESQISSDCGLSAEVQMECDMGQSSLGLGDPCPPDAMRTADTDFLLEVDGEASFARFESPHGVTTTHLAGMAAVGARPARAFVAIVDAPDVVMLDEQALSELRFWFSDDIDLDLEDGSFVVAEPATLAGRGKWNGGWFSIRVEPSASVSGTFEADHWHLDYAGAFPNGRVLVHLEGALDATSPQ